MACRMVVEGHIATVHVTLVDVEARLLQARPQTEGARPPVAEFPEIFRPRAATEEWDPEAFKQALAGELTEDARRLLGSRDVRVEVEWEEGSLEVAAILSAGKLVANVGAFLGGVKAIRVLFPKRIRDRVAGWLGRNVARAAARLEPGTGLLDGKAEEEEPAKAGTGAEDLRQYAVLSVLVLVTVVAAVLGGLWVLGVT